MLNCLCRGFPRLLCMGASPPFIATTDRPCPYSMCIPRGSCCPHILLNTCNELPCMQTQNMCQIGQCAHFPQEALSTKGQLGAGIQGKACLCPMASGKTDTLWNTVAEPSSSRGLVVPGGQGQMGRRLAWPSRVGRTEQRWKGQRACLGVWPRARQLPLSHNFTSSPNLWFEGCA